MVVFFNYSYSFWPFKYDPEAMQCTIYRRDCWNENNAACVLHNALFCLQLLINFKCFIGTTVPSKPH